MEQQVSREELEEINRFTRRPLLPEEVYTFEVVLCNNDIDRDWEAFEAPALHKLASLFIGKTGITDHEAKAANQRARIYRAWVEEEPDRLTADGRPYAALKAKAYMVRTAETRDLALEIDGGIKKEVSVGCAVGQARCSVCGAQRKGEGCAHRPGQRYQGKVCFTLLGEPTDAYEWSFVAVPAQPGAGVVKHWSKKEESSVEELKKQLAAGGALRLTEQQAANLALMLERLEEENQAYRRAVKAKVLGGAPGTPGSEEQTAFAHLLDKLETREMELVGQLLEKAAGSAIEAPQTMVPQNVQADREGEFFI